MIQRIQKPQGKFNKLDTDRLALYAKLVRLNKPIGILLLLWPTLWALFIAAEGMPDLTILIVFILGVVLTRSAGCAINDYADRKIDRFVGRTRDRPIAAGLIQPKEALVVCAVLASIALLMALLFLNKLTIFFALGAAILAASYPFMKRFQSTFPPPLAWLLFTAAVIWTTSYDTLYAMVDREDDIKIGVKSTAILFGPMDKVAVGMLQLTVLFCLVLVGIRAELGWIYYVGLALASLCFVYQHLLIKHRLPDRCFEAFLNNNYFGLIVFLGIFANYYFTK